MLPRSYLKIEFVQSILFSAKILKELDANHDQFSAFQESSRHKKTYLAAKIDVILISGQGVQTENPDEDTNVL